MPASARAERVVLALAVTAGVAISYCFAIARLNVSWFGGAIFVIPLALALLWAGRLRWFGAIYLIAIVAIAFVAAVWGGFYLYSLLDIGICIFCSAEQARDHCRAEISAKVFGTHSVGEEAAGASSSLHRGESFALQQDEIRAVFPVHAHFGRRKIRIVGNRRAGDHHRGRSRRGIQHHFDDFVGNFGGFQG